MSYFAPSREARRPLRTPVLAGSSLSLLIALTACHRSESSDGGQNPGAGAATDTGAVYLDVDGAGTLGPEDQVLVYLPEVSEEATASELLAGVSLPVLRDELGAGATATREGDLLRIQLGAGARLKSRQVHDPSELSINSATGVDFTGPDGASFSVDLVPGLVVQPLDLPGGEAVASLDWDGDARVDVAVASGGQLSVLRGTPEGFELVESFSGPGVGTVHGLLGTDLDRDGRTDLLECTSSGLRTWLRTEGGLELQDTVHGNDVRGIAIFDANRDGIADIALANDGADSILLGEGDGQFNEVGVGSSALTHAVLALDLDSDGQVDLVKAIEQDGETRLLLLMREGIEYVEEELLTATDVRSLAAAHMDRDGRIDLVLGISGEESLRVLYGAGDGTSFEEREHTDARRESTQVLGSTGALRISVSDLDSSGSPDVIVAEAGGIRVYGSHGSSLAEWPGLSASEVSDMLVVDADLDGDLDVLTISPTGSSLHRGSLSATWGRTVFEEGQELGSRPTRSLVAADMDGDGNTELWTGNNLALELWEQSEPGSGWALALELELPDVRFTDLEVFDIDRDGDLDLLAAMEGPSASSSGIWIGLQDGDGGYSEAPGLEGFVIPAASIDLGDLDGDGDLDLAIAGNAAAADQLAINRGYEEGEWLGFEPPAPLGGSEALLESTSELRFHDVDGDGDQDLVSAHTVGIASRVWLNDAGELSPLELPSSLDLNTRSIALGDVDLDGDLDVVGGNAGTESIWLSDGAGGWEALELPGPPSDTFQVVLARVDGDGLLDLVVANRGGNTDEGIQIWLNKGHDDLGQWLGFDEGDGRADHILKRGATSSVLVGDFDHDGDADVVSGSVSPDVPNLLWSSR